MKLAILSLCFLLVGFACAAPAHEQAVRNKAVNELAELQDFLSQLANMQQDEEEGAIQQDEEEQDQASIEELLSSLQQDEEEPDQAAIEELDSALQQGEPEEKAKTSKTLVRRYRHLGQYYTKKAFQLAKQAYRYAGLAFARSKTSRYYALKGHPKKCYHG